MSTSTNKPIDIDAEFDDVHFDEESINRATGIIKRKDNGWYEANTKRLDDQEYLKKLSSSIKSFYQDNPNFQQEKVNSEKWQQNHQAGVKRNLERPDYVNPRGMLGKTRSEETRKKASESSKGHIKPLDGNKKVSEARKGKKPKKESVEKMRKALTGKESGRSRKVQTPAGIFDKLKDAANYYEVSTGSIKNYINGQFVKDWFKPHLESKGVKFKGLKPLGFKWIGDAKKELGAKKIQTPDGIFNSAEEAGKFYNITSAAIRHRIKSQPDKYKKL